jgi:hypothetical protein
MINKVPSSSILRVTGLISSIGLAPPSSFVDAVQSAAFTVDQYADAVPQQLEEAGEKVATVLLDASGSILVAAPKRAALVAVQVIDPEVRPDGLLAAAPLVLRCAPDRRR